MVNADVAKGLAGMSASARLRGACVLDRGFEYSQRSGLPPAAVTWSGDAPDRLSARMTTREAIDIEVLTRDVRPFSPDPPYGFGFTEKLRIPSGIHPRLRSEMRFKHHA